IYHSLRSFPTRRSSDLMHEIEKTASGDYLVRNYNCPIFSLASSHRNICDNEKEMYRQIFPDSDVQAHKYMTRGEKYCSWTITNRSEEQTSELQSRFDVV